jgi:hypothetical protein
MLQRRIGSWPWNFVDPHTISPEGVLNLTIRAFAAAATFATVKENENNSAAPSDAARRGITRS